MIKIRELKTVQTQENLNSVYALDEKGNGGANHKYEVRWGSRSDTYTGGQVIQFQHGPRNAEDSTSGVLGSDLLEIVKDTLTDFQQGPYPSEENEQALHHVEQALIHMNKRVENRIKRNVLGTNQK